MAMTKEDYVAQGKQAAARARAGAVAFCALKEGTWQQKAWKEGYDREQRRSKAQQVRMVGETIPYATPAVIKLSARGKADQERGLALSGADLMVATRAWPRGAAQHAVILQEDIGRERSVARAERLMRALGRMARRWGVSRRLVSPGAEGSHLPAY